MTAGESSVSAFVFHHILYGYRGPEYAVDPDLVGDHDRNEYQGYDGHDPERIDAGRGVEDREAVRRVHAGRDQVREEPYHAG